MAVSSLWIWSKGLDERPVTNAEARAIVKGLPSPSPDPNPNPNACHYLTFPSALTLTLVPHSSLAFFVDRLL